MHADAGRPLARHPPSRRGRITVRTCASADARWRRTRHQWRVPRLWRAAGPVRRRAPGRPLRRGAGTVAARAASTVGVPARRHHADRPVAAPERGRRGGPRARRRSVRARTAARAHGRRPRGAKRRRRPKRDHCRRERRRIRRTRPDASLCEGPLGARRRPGAGLARRRFHRQRRGPHGQRGRIESARTVWSACSSPPEIGQGAHPIFPMIAAGHLACPRKPSSWRRRTPR